MSPLLEVKKIIITNKLNPLKNMKKIITTFSLLLLLIAFKGYSIPKFEYSSPAKLLTQSNPPKIEGCFYRDVDTQIVYWFVGGWLHHIRDPNTYHHLFSNADFYLFEVPYFADFSYAGYTTLPGTTIIGFDVEFGADLVDINGGVYFRPAGDNSHTYYDFADPQTFNGYHFNWGMIKKSTSVPPRVRSIYQFGKWII